MYQSLFAHERTTALFERTCRRSECIVLWYTLKDNFIFALSAEFMRTSCRICGLSLELKSLVWTRP